jgi:hypothetical protein
MTAPAAAPPRLAVAGLAIGLLAAFVLFDLAASAPSDPCAVPAPAALGSGSAAGGAHGAAPPGLLPTVNNTDLKN